MASREQRRRSKNFSAEKVRLTEKKKSTNPAMWVISVLILVVIVVTFIGAPLMGGGSSGNSLIFGSYDGDKITYYQGSYFYDQVISIADEYSDSMTEDNAFFIQYQVWHSAFEKALVRKAAISICKKDGFLFSENAVDEVIVLYGPYMENGEFSDNLYSQATNTEKANVRKRFKEDLYYSRFLSDLRLNRLNDREVEFVEGLGKTEKKFNYVLFPFSDFPDDRLIEYATENSRLFESIKLSSITIDTDKGDAEIILSKLSESPDLFSELAKTQSSDPYAEKGGEIGERSYYDMKNLITDEDFLDGLFGLQAGEISGILDNEDSWVIYKCNVASKKLDLAESASLNVVRDYMMSYARGTIEDYFTKQADVFTEQVEKTGFSEAALDNGHKVYETNYFPIVYGNMSFNYYDQSFPIYTRLSPSDPDKSLSSIVSNEYALKQLAKLEMGDVSEAIVLSDSIAVLQLDDETDKDDEDLEIIGNYISYTVPEWTNAQFESIVLESDKVEDNFSNAFSKIFAQ